MLPSNVVSFMKKMVTTEGVGAATDGGGDTTLSKIRHTLSSSLMTAQDKMSNKLGQCNKQPEVTHEPSKPEEPPPPVKPAVEAGKPVSRSGACRVCLKSFKPEDFSRTCGECHQKVCEDCASYSKPDDTQDEASWRCSICRRRAASRAAQVVGQDSTDSLLDAPVLEALQRRHSDVKLGSNSLSAGGGGVTAGLAPPRSPELRRHSDVSPASLKELEKAVLKVQSERERRQKGRSAAGSPSNSRATSPSVERRSFIPASQKQEDTTQETSHVADSQDEAWRRKQQAARGGGVAGAAGRRKSRVQKQHSYDDEMKPGNAAAPPSDTGLGLPTSLPRRASAYDVYAPRGDPLVALQKTAATTGGAGSGVVGAMTVGGPRRASFRTAPPTQPTEPDDSSSPPSGTPENQPSLLVDEERRVRRRGSQLPDITAVQRAQQARGVAPQPPPPTVVRPTDMDVMRRQTSVTDGEAIKIVIHDVDCDASYGPRTTSKRRVTLRRDPSDKAHRTRGFGMRVVGGKTGLDGRLFAYIVWTVPSGPAEKGGLQQGDKVLEWDGVSLVDKTFEEVCSIMDRTGDTVELLVEHGNDLRMCDLLDEPVPNQVRKNSGEALSLGLVEGEVDKSPASPTRRKLPKTPV